MHYVEPHIRQFMSRGRVYVGVARFIDCVLDRYASLFGEADPKSLGKLRAKLAKKYSLGPVAVLMFWYGYAYKDFREFLYDTD